MNIDSMKITKHIHEYTLPDKEGGILKIHIQCPHIEDKSAPAAKINRYYEKKTKRAVSYYTKSSARLKKRISKHGQEDIKDLYPGSISITFEENCQNGSILSILSCIEARRCEDTEKRYFSENWDISSGRMLLLGDFADSTYSFRREMENQMVSGLEKLCPGGKKLRKFVRGRFSSDNIYFKDGRMYVYFQPEDMALLAPYGDGQIYLKFSGGPASVAVDIMAARQAAGENPGPIAALFKKRRKRKEKTASEET